MLESCPLVEEQRKSLVNNCVSCCAVLALKQAKACASVLIAFSHLQQRDCCDTLGFQRPSGTVRMDCLPFCPLVCWSSEFDADVCSAVFRRISTKVRDEKGNVDSKGAVVAQATWSF